MNDDVKQGLRSATETRSAFTKWEKMVGELYTATGHQQGQTSTEQSQTQAAENVAKIDQQFATEAAQTAKRHAQAVVEQLNKVEKRLGNFSEIESRAWTMLTTISQALLRRKSQVLGKRSSRELRLAL